MTLPIHDRSLPPYVHNLVVEAGRDSVFWASARDPGERPDTGGSMSEWRNRVVGSSQEATQSTASDQPIWRGDQLKFAGDDFFDVLGFENDPDEMLIAGVVSFKDFASSRNILVHRDSLDPHIIVGYSGPAGEFQIYASTSETDTRPGVPKPGAGDDFAFVANLRLGDPTEIDLHASTGSDFRSVSVPSTDYSSAEREIGRSPEFDNHHVGDMAELLLVDGARVSSPPELLSTLESKYA